MLHIVCISDSHKQFAPAVDEYTKRLQKSVNIVLVKPSRKDDPISVIREETALLYDKISKLPKPRILLEKDGQQMSSEELALYLQTTQQHGTFIMGGPFGVDVSFLKPHMTKILSRGKQTMPHGLALVVLLEQIRRAQCINEGRTYHY